MEVSWINPAVLSMCTYIISCMDLGIESLVPPTFVFMARFCREANRAKYPLHLLRMVVFDITWFAQWFDAGRCLSVSNHIVLRMEICIEFLTGYFYNVISFHDFLATTILQCWYTICLIQCMFNQHGRCWWHGAHASGHDMHSCVPGFLWVK